MIVEPVAGSTGVLIPPKGYLQRLREICTKHGILLIFDEVITGFGRTGAAFAAEKYGVMPDMITCAKGLTNGVIPMGAVLTTGAIHDAFMTGPEHLIELFHGYTYSGNPIAAAAGLATLETYAEEGLFERAAALAPVWEEALHSLQGLPARDRHPQRGADRGGGAGADRGRSRPGGRSRRSSTPTRRGS